jgi:hypothetical protein
LECWTLIHIFIPPGAPYDVIHSFKGQLQVNFFMEIIILMCWIIWMARNDLIFRGQQPTLHLAAQRFKSEIALCYEQKLLGNKLWWHIYTHGSAILHPPNPTTNQPVQTQPFSARPATNPAFLPLRTASSQQLQETSYLDLTS